MIFRAGWAREGKHLSQALFEKDALNEESTVVGELALNAQKGKNYK